MDELFGDQPLGHSRKSGKDGFKTIIIIGLLKMETLKAVQVLTEDDNMIWLPLSQIEVKRLMASQGNSSEWPEDMREFHMPLWLAKEKGLI